MGLAGENDLHRALAPEQRQRPLGIASQQLEPLVGGDPPREPEREHVRIERSRGRLDVFAGVAAREPVGGAARPDELDELGSLLSPRRPQILVGHRVDGGPDGGRVGVRQPVVPERAVEQRAHRLADPRRHVHAVRDVADRHRLHGLVRPQLVPHLPRDAAVTRADAVRRAAEPQGRLGHAERLLEIARMGPPELDQQVRRRPQVGGHHVEHRRHLRRRVRVVAGWDRRVRGEHRPQPRVLEVAGAVGRELDRRERRVALVQVDHARIDPERPQRAHAADPEQRVLGEPDVPVAFVQPARDPALERAVGRDVRVEQEQRHAPDVDPPDPRGHLRLADRQRNRQRRPVAGADERARKPRRVGVEPVLVLPATGVDPLAEVALAVHQSDRDHRQPAVGCLLQQVAGEGPEPARVDRQRHVHPVLGAEERHRPSRVDRGRVGRAAELGHHPRVHRCRPLDQLAVGGRAREHSHRRLLEHPHRVLLARLEALGVDRPEQIGAAEQPRPAVVVGEPGERRERGRKPLGQLFGGARDIAAPLVGGGHRRIIG